MEQTIRLLNKQFEKASISDVLIYLDKEYSKKIVFSTSFSIEDQVITDFVLQKDINIRIFTLDTGRVFPETYTILDKTSKKYNTKIEIYFPKYEAVQNMVKAHGINLFYDSIENRKLCCNIRKVEPLERALAGNKVWISGLRKEQSVTRSDLQLFTWDEGHQIIKYNPLTNWTEKEVWDYIKTKNIPYNELYDKSYASIGCQPCTRPIKVGEDVRAGRWWWESPEQKECGLHVQDGKLVRKNK